LRSHETSGEVDVREVLRAIREELATQTDQQENPEGDSESNDVRIMRTHYNVREYEIATDRKLAPMVIGVKKVIEAVVRPYAGHFLDKQAHYNASLSRIVTRVLSRLDSIDDQLRVIHSEQSLLRETIESEMGDVRERLESLRTDAAERHRTLSQSVKKDLDRQMRKLDKRGASRRKAAERAKTELIQGLEETRTEARQLNDQHERFLTEAVQSLQDRLTGVERKAVESLRDVEERTVKELTAVVDFLEEILHASTGSPTRDGG